jgi:hypothetical protein
MKTFVEFILICEKLNKTHDENSQSKLWNYFIANPDDRKIRDLILNNDLKKAEEEIKKQVSAAKTNPEHPLNFANAGDEEFSKKEGRQPNDEQDYNNFLDDSVSGLLALSKQKKLKSAIEKGFPSRVTGSGASELSKKFKEAGGTDKTPKGDLEIYNPDDPKDRRGISMKKGAGAQLASAEGGELKGMYKIAAKEFVKKFHSDKSKEERGRIEKEIMSDAERLSAIGRLQKTAGEAPDVDKQKQSLKNVSQGISDRLLDKYPQFERLLSQVATSGRGKFKGDEGTAGIVLTGKNKDKEASAKPAEQQKSSKPRLALPKGTSRPGNLKIDYRPEEPVSRQSTFSDFSKQATEAQQALAAAEAEKQSAQNELETNPDGTKTYRQHQAQKKINNPNLNARLTTADQAVQTANMTFADIQARAAQAKEILAVQSQQQKPEVQQQQRTEPVDTKPQQPTTEPSQPQQPQPTQTPPSTQPQQTQTPPPEQQQQQPAPEQQQQQPAPEQKPEPKKKKPKPENTETADQAGQ